MVHPVQVRYLRLAKFYTGWAYAHFVPESTPLNSHGSALYVLERHSRWSATTTNDLPPESCGDVFYNCISSRSFVSNELEEENELMIFPHDCAFDLQQFSDRPVLPVFRVLAITARGS